MALYRLVDGGESLRDRRVYISHYESADKMRSKIASNRCISEWHYIENRVQRKAQQGGYAQEPSMIRISPSDDIVDFNVAMLSQSLQIDMDTGLVYVFVHALVITHHEYLPIR